MAGGPLYLPGIPFLRMPDSQKRRKELPYESYDRIATVAMLSRAKCPFCFITSENIIALIPASRVSFWKYALYAMLCNIFKSSLLQIFIKSIPDAYVIHTG